MKTRLCLLLLLFRLGTLAQTPREPVTLSDMLRIRQASGIKASADGATLYFVLGSTEPEPDKKWEYQYLSQIWSVNTAGTPQPRQLSSSKDGASQITLSPDGQQLLFLRKVEGSAQLFLLPLGGGEAIQLTRFKYGISSPCWSPDGKQIAFQANIPWKDLVNDSTWNPGHSLPLWPSEKPGFQQHDFLNNSKARPYPDGSLAEARAWLQLNETDKKAKVINRLQFQDESTTTGDLPISQIFLFSPGRDSVPRRVTKRFNSFWNPLFLSETNLLMTGEADEKLHPDRNQAMGLYTVRTDGSGLLPFLVKKDSNYYSASLSASRKWIAFLMGSTRYPTLPTLAIMPAGGNEKDIIRIPLDREKANLTWKGDDRLYGTFLSNGGSKIFLFDLASGKLHTLGAEEEGISSIAVAGNLLAYTKTAVADPSEVFTGDLYAKNEKQLTRFNQQWLTNKIIVQPNRHHFVNELGQPVTYFVMKPAGFSPGKKFPLLLQIHGGPAVMWGPGESSMWHEFQFWCGKGYGVVYANPRGSGGYGTDFLRSNVNDWGRGPMKDVLQSLKETIAEGWVDTTQLFLSGGSYAGYLVAYILGHDQRFKAACSQRGVYDLRTFFGEGNAWRLVPYYFGGLPWDSATKEKIENESPLTYVQNVHTPLIMFHGDNDLRTGVVSGEQYYKSLKALGRPVEYVRHPGATHEITRSGNNRQRMDQLLRTWEFFERFR